MLERTYRIVLGASLFLLLYLRIDLLLYIYIGILVFEAAFNLRIPLIVSRIRHGRAQSGNLTDTTGKINFEAERMFRFVIAVLLILTYFVFPDMAWFFPWFLGFMMLLAGITNLCPLMMTLSWLRFK